MKTKSSPLSKTKSRSLPGQQLAAPGPATQPGIRIRPAARKDGPALLQLIIALAKFEKLDPPGAAAQKRLLRDAFGKKPRFEAWLAFVDDRPSPVGYAFFLESYSSFLARPTFYLEDVFVMPEFRHRGIGSALLQLCFRLAHQRGCGRMEWVCLDWNKHAQTFYETLGARRLSEWYIYRLTREQLAKLANGKPSRKRARSSNRKK